MYLIQGSVYTVHYSNWELSIEADGYDAVRENLSRYRGDTSYPGRPRTVGAAPIVIPITRRAVTL